MNFHLKAITAGCGAIAVTAAVLLVSQAEPVSTSQPVYATQGMVTVIDKDSGELRAPTADEARNYQTPVLRSDAPLTVERRADGSESMKLDDRYMTYSTVQRQADGSWSRQCSMDHDHAQHAQKAVR